MLRQHQVIKASHRLAGLRKCGLALPSAGHAFGTPLQSNIGHHYNSYADAQITEDSVLRAALSRRQTKQWPSKGPIPRLARGIGPTATAKMRQPGLPLLLGPLR